MKNRKLYGQFIKYKYESILGYNAFVEKNIKEAVSSIDAKYEEFVKSNPGITEVDDEEYEDRYLTVVDDFASESQKLSGDILQHHRKAILFHFYSFLEKELYRIGGIVGEGHTSKMADSKGNTPIEKFKSYIKIIEPALLKEVREDLIYFNQVRVVRNIVTHENSIVKEGTTAHSRIKNFSSNRFKMLLMGTNKVGIEVYRIELDNQNFIKEMFEKFKSFTDKIYK